MTAQHQGWIDSYRQDQKKHRKESDLMRRRWKVVKNNIDVPRHQERRQNQQKASGILVARRGKSPEDLTAKDLRIAAFVCAKLTASGRNFDFRIEATDGVVYATVLNVTLKPTAQQPSLRLVSTAA